MSDTRERRIRERAYELWENDGRKEGGAPEYWELAERMIDEEANAGPPTMTEKPPL